MRRTVPPSAEIEGKIEKLMAAGIDAGGPQEALGELAGLGAKLIIQRAVEEEFEAWLGRGRYERKAEAPPGKRNGWRPRRLQGAEGEIDVEIPQVREAAEPFVSKLFPRGKRFLRTEPLKAMVIGAFVTRSWNRHRPRFGPVPSSRSHHPLPCTIPSFEPITPSFAHTLLPLSRLY